MPTTRTIKTTKRKEMANLIAIDRACEPSSAPSDAQFSRWVTAALDSNADPIELSIRLVDEIEGENLNQFYRGKSGATNVLSFPFDAVAPVALPILGDLVICEPVVIREAREQNKSLDAHWAHMVVHGVLHLLGYDHINDLDTDVMENLETKILLSLNYPAPYTASSKQS